MSRRGQENLDAWLLSLFMREKNVFHTIHE